MSARLSLMLAEVVALSHAKAKAWRLGTVHEIRVRAKLSGVQPMTIDFSTAVTRRRDLTVAL